MRLTRKGKSMDFGVLYEMQVKRPWTEQSEGQAYWDTLEQAVVAEQVGFTHVWAVEHHFREEHSHLSSPEIWLTAVAQHTKSVRLGHGIALLPIPFNHPIRVAERAGALDIMSNGRLELGTGRSVVELELEGFRIDPGDSRPMWEESMAFLQKLWGADGEPIEFEGRFFSMPSRRVLPRPVQRPHPPMWMAATNPATFTIAGDYGLGVLAFGMATSKEAMGRRISEYKAALEATTRPMATKNEQAAVMLMCFCARSYDEARRTCEDAFVDFLDHSIDVFVRWGEKKELPPGYEWYAEAAKKAKKQSGKEKFDYLVENGMVLVGTPDDICETIEAYRRVGATQIIALTQLGKIAQTDTLDSLSLFGKGVIPNFR
jgi:alkanesulfonate monooxygenase SsuD/methylene tetrahydromethanopterin reductase-like flavin-dependent oxidoreductase (luciferase family)